MLFFLTLGHTISAPVGQPSRKRGKGFHSVRRKEKGGGLWFPTKEKECNVDFPAGGKNVDRLLGISLHRKRQKTGGMLPERGRGKRRKKIGCLCGKNRGWPFIGTEDSFPAGKGGTGFTRKDARGIRDLHDTRKGPFYEAR